MTSNKQDNSSKASLDEADRPTAMPNQATDAEEDFPRCNSFAYFIGRFFMKLMGWRVAGGPAKSKSMIIIAAPHTSNWDAVFLLGAAYSFRLSVKWLVKNNVFVPILGRVVSFLGGVPVDRARAMNMVGNLAKAINESKEGMALVVPPAGTRGYTEHWKSGFYRIALEADIPIVCGYLDYPKKEAGLGLSFKLSGDMKQDMDRIREFYEPIVAKYPKDKSRIVLREEERPAKKSKKQPDA